MAWGVPVLDVFLCTLHVPYGCTLITLHVHVRMCVALRSFLGTQLPQPNDFRPFIAMVTCILPVPCIQCGQATRSGPVRAGQSWCVFSTWAGAEVTGCGGEVKTHTCPLSVPALCDGLCRMASGAGTSVWIRCARLCRRILPGACGFASPSRGDTLQCPQSSVHAPCPHSIHTPCPHSMLTHCPHSMSMLRVCTPCPHSVLTH